jgi:hypothetical protein
MFDGRGARLAPFIIVVRPLLLSCALYYCRAPFIIVVRPLLLSCALYYCRAPFIIVVRPILTNYKITAILTLQKSRVGEACSEGTYRTIPNQQAVAIAKSQTQSPIDT